MDDRRFDAFVKSFASGTHRRALVKGLLGLGGAAATGGLLLERSAEAARRPTPTPKPLKCPGKQLPCAVGCCCPPGLEGCGPDCCTEDNVPAPQIGHSECCDNACCFGTCYGEELCCPTNLTSGDGPPASFVCKGANGPNCCAAEQSCCDGASFGRRLLRRSVAARVMLSGRRELWSTRVQCLRRTGTRLLLRWRGLRWMLRLSSRRNLLHCK
jgi:hypothetical protein